MWNLLKRYELISISISIILFKLMSDNFEDKYIQSGVNFLTILAIIHILSVYIPKCINFMKLQIIKLNELISFYKSIERIDQLTEEQQKILNILYLKEDDKFHSYTKEIKSLIDKKFIILVQNIQGTLNLYKLNKRVYKYLDNKNINQIKDYLITLSDNEKYVLNQFYDNSQKNYYKAEFSEVIETLINKKIIERKNDKMIVISKYAKNLLKYYRKEEIKHIEIELGKDNIYAPINCGGGATGSYK